MPAPGRPLEIGVDGLERLDRAVVAEELRRVPQRQQPPLDLLCRAEAEQEIAVGRLGAVLPAHHVGTHARERVLRVDHVAPRAVHLLAVLVEHLLVAQDLLERCPPGQRDRHQELRVEPEPDLLAHLRHPVGREPLLPRRVIGEVGRRQAPSGARCVPLGEVLRVLPAERRERDDAGVEPDVTDLLHPLDGLAACLATHLDGVDPGAPELLQLVEAAEGALLELGPRADHVQVPARTRVERQRQAVVAAPGDVPVAHVAQPVVHALAHVPGRPFDRRVRVEQRLTELVDSDEPVVREAEDQRRVAAPAEGIAVLGRLRAHEQATVAEVADDLLRRLDGREAVQPAVLGIEPARLVDGRQHGELVHLRELEVLAAAAGRDVDDAGARVEGDVVPRDHAVLDLRAGLERVERPAVAPADELGPLDDAREALVREERTGNPLPVLEQAVVGGRVDRRGDVRGQRPRGRRPDDDPLALVVEQREADVERGVEAVLVVAVQLVGGDRGAAARAPLGRAMAHDEPPAVVDDPQEAPDVLDVRVGEREVVVAPVHPLPEPDRALRQLLRRADDDVTAPASELCEPVLLDLALGVEPERALDADLDPEALAVEAVLVALVVPAQRLVALEDVLERPSPGRMDGQGLVRGDRAVEEAEPGAVCVLRPQLRERRLALPEREDLPLERVMVGLVRKGCEHHPILEACCSSHHASGEESGRPSSL